MSSFDPSSSSGASVRRGDRFDQSDPEDLRRAIGAVVHYRGDVTITRRSTGETLVGYLFDFTSRGDEHRGDLRVLPQDGGGAVAIALDDVAALEVSGRDTAAGKSFEAWIGKYLRKKQAGEAASIEPDEQPDQEPDERGDPGAAGDQAR